MNCLGRSHSGCLTHGCLHARPKGCKAADVASPMAACMPGQKAARLLMWPCTMRPVSMCTSVSRRVLVRSGLCASSKGGSGVGAGRGSVQAAGGSGMLTCMSVGALLVPHRFMVSGVEAVWVQTLRVVWRVGTHGRASGLCTLLLPAA